MFTTRISKASIFGLMFASLLITAESRAQNITLDTVSGKNQVFGVGGTAVGSWSPSALTLFTPLTINNNGGVQISNAAEPLSAASANTVAALKNMPVCASGEVLTKTGPTSFACTSSSTNGNSANGGTSANGTGFPTPTNEQGIGQWIPLPLTLSGGSIGCSRLPEGGRWAYYGSNNGTGFAGVADGGSVVWGCTGNRALSAANNFFGFAWRVQ